jgi:hypothetical protein
MRSYDAYLSTGYRRPTFGIFRSNLPLPTQVRHTCTVGRQVPWLCHFLFFLTCRNGLGCCWVVLVR